MSFMYDIFENEEDALKAREFPLIPHGDYDFVIVESIFKWSSANNPMISLKHKTIFEGREFFVFGNLIGTKNMAWLTKHFCESTGLKEAYLANKFNEKLALGRKGRYTIGIDEARLKNNGTGEMYKAKNKVLDYISEENSVSSRQAPNPFAPVSGKKTTIDHSEDPGFQDDDLPF